MEQTDGAVILRRSAFGGWDLRVETDLPRLRTLVVAHEIRKDMWRRLQGLRGFAPMVQVSSKGVGLHVAAGGSVSTKNWPKAQVEQDLSEILNNSRLRSRWINHARER